MLWVGRFHYHTITIALRSAFLCLVIFSCYQTAAWANKKFIDGVIAVVDGEVVLLSDLDLLKASLINQAQQTGALNREALLERKIEDILVRRRAQKIGIQITEPQVNQAIEQIAADNKMSKEQLLQMLAAQGLSESSYRTVLREQIMRSQIVQQEIEPFIRIDKADLIAYMKEHPKEFASAPVVKLKLMTLSGQALSMSIADCQRVAACLNKTLSPNDVKVLTAATPELEIDWLDLATDIQQWIASIPQRGHARVFRSAEADTYLLVVFFESASPKMKPFDEVYEQVYGEVRRIKLEEAFQQWLANLHTMARIERFALP